MLRHIIEKELRDCLYGYCSLLIFVLSAVLFSITVYSGSRQYRAALEEFHLAQQAYQRQRTEPANLYALGNFGFDVVKPPPVLGVLVSGVEPLAPRVYNVALFTLPEARGSLASESPTTAVFGPLDMVFIVQVVLGLAALLFTFSAICGEKENGTLKLTLANAVPKDTLLVGKFLGNLLGLLVPVAVAFLLGLILLLCCPEITLSADDLLRTVVLAGGFLLYLIVLFALGLFVSTLTARSTTAFALSLVAWVFLVTIAPRFAVLAAKQISPTKSLQEFETQKVQIHRRGFIEAQEEYNQYLRTHHQEVPPLEVYYDITRRIRDKQNSQLRVLEDDYMQQKQRQDHWALFLSRCSPAGSLSYAAMSLARTGEERDFRFQAALREYRAAFTRYFDRKSLEESQTVHAYSSQDLTQDLSDQPEFTFAEEPFSVSLDRALPDLGFLVLWSVMLFVGCYFRFLQYDVR